ncbi:unnamed protein product [Caenorhabditis brenneri]
MFCLLVTARVTPQFRSNYQNEMNLPAILISFFCFLLFLTTPVMARHNACKDYNDCNDDMVCEDNFCYTFDEIMEKFKQVSKDLDDQKSG